MEDSQQSETADAKANHCDETASNSSSTPSEVDAAPLTRRDVLAAGAANLAMSAGLSMAEAADQPGHATTVAAGHLHVHLKSTENGIHLQSLYDKLDQRELLANQPGSLWKIVMYNPQTNHITGERYVLRADTGWTNTEIVTRKGSVELRWNRADDDRFADVSVVVQVKPEAAEDAIHWDISVTNDSDWAVYEVAFPQAGLKEMDDGKLFFPFNEGVEEDEPWSDSFDTFNFMYPHHTSNLQYFSVYDPSNTGLYFGVHDPEPTYKIMTAKTPNADQGLRLRFRQPAPDMVVAGNDFTLSGESVWQLYEGDWYDAAMLYREWVSENAPWYPERDADGRADTPEWMRELPVWIDIHTGRRTTEEWIEDAKDFAEFVDVPVGVHWYGWFDHEFDNDYPDYTADDEFAAGVKELQDAGMYVMPYVNSRLWDTRLESFAETGREGACKDPNGTVYEVNYGNRTEDDGSLVRLAVMDPSTDVWQETLRTVSGRLFDEYGVDGVYFDQLGNSPSIFPEFELIDDYSRNTLRDFGDPSALCYDSDHDHPLGGGHWWTEGYQELLASIREEMPDDGILTCESSPEMYADYLDGWLVFMWGREIFYIPGEVTSVPAVVAVYGGAVQMFGRGFKGPEKSDDYRFEPMARVKAARMLTYGNQLGWWNPTIVNNDSLATYARRLIHLRQQLTRYFTAGRMERPPELDVPMYTTTWPRRNNQQTTPAVLSSAWSVSNQGRLVFVFANPTENDVTTEVTLDMKDYEMAGELKVETIGPDGKTGETFTVDRHLQREVTFEAKTAWAWEVVVN